MLLLDEPTQGVDVAAKAQIHALIRDFARRGGGVLVSSSDLAELTRVCDQICALHQGTITARLDRVTGFDEARLHAASADDHGQTLQPCRPDSADHLGVAVRCDGTPDQPLPVAAHLTNILVQSSIMAVIAIGMTFVIIGGGFDLSVGSIVAFAGCIAAMTMVKFGIAAGVLAGSRPAPRLVSPTGSSSPS